VIDESTGNLSRQEEIRINRERECVQKVQTMLAKVVGFGNSVVSVTADFTFKDETKTATEYDPDGKVTLEESILTSETTGESPRPAVGASGAESNINNAAGSAGRGKTILSKQEDMTSKLGHSMTITEGTYNSPTLNQLSVSVQINSAKINEIDTPEFRQSIQTAIQKAVGFRDAQDEISVEFLPFANVPIPEIPVAFALPWDKINEMLKNISLGIAAIIALFMARKAFNKIQPDPAAVQDVVNKESQVNQLSELVKDNPEVFSKIIASWSSLESNEESDGTQSRKAA
jgi:flagellar biosynthesis/type III secretory pathway M-ring protein FliF/YscJ